MRRYGYRSFLQTLKDMQHDSIYPQMESGADAAKKPVPTFDPGQNKRPEVAPPPRNIMIGNEFNSRPAFANTKNPDKDKKTAEPVAPHRPNEIHRIRGSGDAEGESLSLSDIKGSSKV